MALEVATPPMQTFTEVSSGSEVPTPRALAASDSICERSLKLDLQSQVEALASWECAELRGRLRIGGEVVDLKPLASLRAIRKGLHVDHAHALRSLGGLEGLNELGMNELGEPNPWSLMIRNSPAIESIAALRNVRALPGGLYVENNSALETLAGLENVSELCTPPCRGYAIVAKNNLVLRNLSALRNVRGSLRGVILQSNWGMTSLDGLQGITGLQVGLDVTNHFMLESLEPLGGARTDRPITLHIDDNPRLVSLHGLGGIPRCEEVSVSGNARLQSLAALGNLTGPVPGYLEVSWNSRLPDLHGLEGISSVGSLTIRGNAMLKSLTALSGVGGSLSGALAIESNPELRSLHGLQRITGVGTGFRETKTCIGVESNQKLQSVQALAGISGNLQCLVFFRQQRPLTSFQVLSGATFDRSLTLSPSPRCFSTRERTRLFGKRVNGWPVVLPAPQWEEGVCRECPPCGVQGGLAVPCDMSSGRCFCPLGWTGENCSSPAPRVSVLPRQRYVCARPKKGSLVECRVEIALRRAAGAEDLSVQHHFTVEAAQVQALRVDETHGSLHAAVWANETHGSISITLLSTFGHHSAVQVLRVGYAPDSQPAQFLDGTVPSPSPVLENTVFPWCVDSGDCSQFAPQQVFVETCPAGHVPSADGVHCVGCGMFRRDASGDCSVDLTLGAAFAIMLVGLLTLSAQVGCIDAGPLALHFRSRRMPIHDVSWDGGRVLVSTWGPHHFHMWLSKSFPIRFKGTGCRYLDAPEEPFRARVAASDQLELLDLGGKPIQAGSFESSMGFVQLPLHRTIAQTGWPVPAAFSVPLLIAASVAIALLQGISKYESLVLAGAAAASCVVGLWSRRKRAGLTPLARRLEAYDARRSSTKPKSTPRGEDRAISAEQLVDFDSYFQEFIRSRNMHYVVANIVKLLTAASQSSFAEYVGPSRLAWFASHFWGTEFKHFCSSIKRHAQLVGDWESQCYWICSFSINQHTVEEEVNTDYKKSSFYLALRSSSCSGTCMVVDEEALPLTRSWCLFELLQTIEVERAAQAVEVDGRGTAGFQGLFFCTSTGVLNSGRASLETSMALGRRLATLRLEDAKASVAADKAMIDDLVENTMGGFDGMNRALRTRISGALRASKEQAVRDFEVLEQALTV